MANFCNTKIPRLILFPVLEPQYQWSRFLHAKPQLRKLSCGPTNYSNSQSTPLPEYSESQSDARHTASALVQYLASYYVQLWTDHERTFDRGRGNGLYTRQKSELTVRVKILLWEGHCNKTRVLGLTLAMREFIKLSKPC